MQPIGDVANDEIQDLAILRRIVETNFAGSNGTGRAINSPQSAFSRHVKLPGLLKDYDPQSFTVYRIVKLQPESRNLPPPPADRNCDRYLRCHRCTACAVTVRFSRG